MDIHPNDRVLSLGFEGSPFARGDVFAGSYRKAEVQGREYRPLKPDIKQLPWKDKAFDMVYVEGFLEQCDHPVELLEEIKRISKRFHLKCKSLFAEMLFGWPQNKWVISLIGDDVVIAQKDSHVFGRFESFFHNLYVDDPTFQDFCSRNQGLMSSALEWYEDNPDKFYPCSIQMLAKNQVSVGKIERKIDIEHIGDMSDI